MSLHAVARGTTLLQSSSLRSNRFASAASPTRTAFSRSAASRRSVVMAAVKLSQDELKKQAAWQAVDYVKSGMKLGLGTGSTAAFAVARIGELLANGELKDIVAVPTSIATYNQAKSEWRGRGGGGGQ